MLFWGITLYNSMPAYNIMSSNSLFTCAIAQDLKIQLEILYKMRKVWFEAWPLHFMNMKLSH